jgi:hypothetical protein
MTRIPKGSMGSQPYLWEFLYFRQNQHVMVAGCKHEQVSGILTEGARMTLNGFSYNTLTIALCQAFLGVN